MYKFITEKYIIFIALLISFSYLLIGCFGNIGSKTNAPSNSLTYLTSWLTQGTLIGSSQIVSVSDQTTQNLQTITINKSTEKFSNVFSNLVPGKYLLKANLYSGLDGSGQMIGEIKSYIDLTNSATFETKVGANPKSLVIQQSRGSITAGESNELVVFGVDTNNKNTFLDPSNVSWIPINNVDQLSQTGIAFSNNSGQANVQVKYLPNNLSKFASYSVNPYQKNTTPIVFHIFMNAANTISEPLFPFSNLNIRQLLNIATTSHIKFIVQWKQSQEKFPDSSFDGTRRYLISPGIDGKGELKLLQDLGTTIDMGNPLILTQFLNYSIDRYPGIRNGAIMWSHGNGWLPGRGLVRAGRAFSFDEDFNTSINIWNLREALQNHQFDWFVWDSSYMQMLEVAYELKNNTKFVIGSEESPPIQGYPYDKVFSIFRDNITVSSNILARAFVDTTLEVENYKNRKITQSVIDTSQLDAVGIAIRQLGQELITNQETIQDIITNARSNAQRYNSNFYDLIDLLNIIQNSQSVSSSLRMACNNATIALRNAITYQKHNNNSLNSNGLSINFSSSSTFLPERGNYQRLLLSIDTLWDNWLAISP